MITKFKKEKVIKVVGRKDSLLALSVMMAIASTSASAIELVKNDDTEVNLNLEAILGTFSLNESFGNAESNPSWQEVSLKAGVTGSKSINKDIKAYGGLNLVGTAAFGDGEASGTTSGNERLVDVDEAYVGIKKGIFDFSVGSQAFTIGDGFIIGDDGLNFGDFGGAAPELDRGGAYYLGGSARKAFSNSAILRVGSDKGLRGDLFWLKSDNKGQAQPEMVGLNVEYTNDLGTFGAMHLDIIDITPSGALGGFLDNPQRDGQTTTSVRFQGNAGKENLFLSAEYATQKQGDDSDDADAFYAEVGYTFADAKWAPAVNIRHSQFDNGYDQLFIGFTRGYSTWFQGEVWSNFSAQGPGNTGAEFNTIHATVNPKPTLKFGAVFNDINDTTNAPGRSDAKELDLYAEWVVNDHLILSPLVGLYNPDEGEDSVYLHLLAIIPF